MRQAGRSLPEYRAVRGEGTILDIIADPDLATEITLQPVRRYGVDAAILFSDIVVPVNAVGFGIDIVPGVGPVADRPFTASPPDLDRLRPLEPDTDTPYVIETVRQLTAELDAPLIGFAGGPFTVASLPHRGRTVTQSPSHQDPHDQRRGLVARLAGPLGRYHHRLSTVTSRGGRLGCPTLRQLGWSAEPRSVPGAT